MKVSFYGTRGSCPTPGLNTAKYGGNTACVLLESNNGQKLIIDAGTGIRVLGNRLLAEKTDIYLLISHNHYDHIQGFPFFKPLYQKGRVINIYPAVTSPNQPRAIVEQMHGSYSPIDETLIFANLNFHQPNWDKQPIEINGFLVSRLPLNHPNAGMAYLVEADGKKVAYVTDNELNAPNLVVTMEQWQAFVKNVDLLIHDGQYIEADMPLKHGWGHSLITQSLELAKLADVKRLAIYSHDPERTDQDLDGWQEKVNAMELTFSVIMSQEGQELTL